jgi:hypothetical protein
MGVGGVEEYTHLAPRAPLLKEKNPSPAADDRLCSAGCCTARDMALESLNIQTSLFILKGVCFFYQLLWQNPKVKVGV